MTWKSTIVFVALAVMSSPVPAAPEEEDPKLLGPVTQAQLEQEPYSEWFRKSYDEYVPNPDVLTRLRDMGAKGVTIRVFFGTWCPDSQRQVPRLLKLLHELSFPADALSLVAVDDDVETLKRSPGGEEKGVEVFKVPTIVVTRRGGEAARIIEHPVLSLERDLLTIFSGEPYESTYIAYPTVRRWLREGLLLDENLSARGLAGQIRQEIQTERDLSAVSGVLLSRGQAREAILLNEVNCVLFPHSARAHADLAISLHREGKDDEAREAAEAALGLDPDRYQMNRIVELLSDLPAAPD